MERLTEYTTDGFSVTRATLKNPIKTSTCTDCKKGCEDCSLSIAVARLAAYEDTGLDPEDIKMLQTAHTAAKAELDATAKTLIGLGIHHDGIGDHIRELLAAERDGKLVRLPCNVGDTVYVLETLSDEPISEWTVKNVGITAEQPGFGIEREFEAFGKTLFLTHKEAEAALKEALK